MEQMQALWSELSYTASEPAGEDLKQRIWSSLPAPAQSVHQTTMMEAIRMRKRLVVAGALVLLVVATGLVAGNFFAGTGRGNGMVNGHKWEYTSTFQGRVNCLNPDGSKAHVGMITLTGDPSQGEVKLTVDGTEYTFQGVGKHEVRDAKTDELYGYVDMTPAPSQKEMDKEWAEVTSGHMSTKLGSEGFDKTLGYSWELHGAAKVTIQPAASDGWTGGGGGTVESHPDGAPSVPELAITTKSGVITKRGFGTYEIPGEDGKPVARLVIEPADAPK